VGIPRRLRRSASLINSLGIVLCLGAASRVSADPPADAPKTLPQENFLSSIKESLRLGYDHEVVRGHFDLGSPNPRRYYCLIDTKTGRREPNAVLGKPVRLADGTTGLESGSVSLYACDNAEKQGMLVTAGYLLKTPGGGVAAQPPQPTQPPAPSQAAVASQAAVPPMVSADKIDVAGVKLGMSLDAARTVLKSKKLSEYNESTETLSYLDSAKSATQSIADGHFVNTIATWTASAAGDGLEAAGESYEVMFTPVPGKERVMAIIHSVGYAPADAVQEVVLENGLAKKYGGFAGANNLPESPTWLFQGGGKVRIGDVCNRRGLFGGLGRLNLASRPLENLALRKTPDELRFEAEHCGVAIVTEDHYTPNGGSLGGDRLVTRFTVTAYSPAVALEGAEAAAQLIEAAKGVLNKADAARAKNKTVPNL